jgi:hypothetical protein
LVLDQLFDDAQSEVGSGPVVRQRGKKRRTHICGGRLLGNSRVAFAEMLPDEKDVEIGQLRRQLGKTPGVDRDVETARRGVLSHPVSQKSA